MKDDTRRHLSLLILNELAEKIKGNELLARRLEMFTDLPVDKVAQAIINQFEYLLSSDLRELIIHLIEQDIAFEQSQSIIPPDVHSFGPEERSEDVKLELPPLPEEKTETAPEIAAGRIEETVSPPSPPEEVPVVDSDTESIMEHFAVREAFPTEAIDSAPAPDEWLYLYGFSYAPDSSGKGEISKRIRVGGPERPSEILIMDYGDLRIFLRVLPKEQYALDKSGKPTLTAQKSSQMKLEHERVLNLLRSEDVLVPVPFWSIIHGHEGTLGSVERKYVDMLRALIDVHDAVDWDVDVMAFDDIIMQLPSMADTGQDRVATRSSRHPGGRSGVDVRKMEKIIFREKALAQEIHNELILLAGKNKVDYMVRLDSAIMGDWKSILSARYHIGKEKRRTFCQTIVALQNKHQEYQLMFKVTNPISRFSFLD